MISRSTNCAIRSLLRPSHRLVTQRLQLQTTMQAARKDTAVESLGPQLQAFIREKQELCQPDSIHICDGSQEENDYLVNQMIESKMMKRLTLYDDW